MIVRHHYSPEPLLQWWFISNLSTKLIHPVINYLSSNLLFSHVCSSSLIMEGKAIPEMYWYSVCKLSILQFENKYVC